jgi:hypothetical protein
LLRVRKTSAKVEAFQRLRFLEEAEARAVHDPRGPFLVPPLARLGKAGK